MIKKFNRQEPEYRSSVQRLLEFLLGEYILYLTLWKAYDPVNDEFNNRRTFWASILTLFSIIFIMTLFTAALVVIAKLI